MLAPVIPTPVAAATVIACHDLKVLPVEPPVSVAALDPEGIAQSVLKPGDKLKAVNGKVVGDATQGAALLANATEKVALAVVRDGAEQTVEIFKPEASTKVGVTLAGGWRAKVQVAGQVAEGGAAAGLLFQGDQMCAINGTTVTDQEQWSSLARGAVGDVVFSIMRGGDFITVTVNKPEATTKMGVDVKDILATTTPTPGAPPISNQVMVRDGPPPGAPPGGQWMLAQKYVGPKTKQVACVACLCFCLPGLCMSMLTRRVMAAQLPTHNWWQYPLPGCS